uniref:Uncharacterized protein n=1 Tax=Trichobilharzia regenti TaxID=157069 RepID=A0AA85JLB6_TRIRE|nr:unnamed protein product [Trichobilharzia regenti]
MTCRHRANNYFFERPPVLEYVSNNSNNLNCVDCLNSVICNNSLEIDARDAYISKFLKYFESSKVHNEPMVCRQSILEKLVKHLLVILPIAKSSFAHRILSVLKCIFCTATEQMRKNIMTNLYYQITYLSDKNQDYTCYLEAFCTLLDDLTIRDVQCTDTLTNFVCSLLRVIYSSLNESTIHYMDSLLKCLPRGCLESVKIYLKKVLEVISKNKSHKVVEAGLGCLLKLCCICNGSFADIRSCREFPVALRALLSSHDEIIKEITINFIEFLLCTFGEKASMFVCTCGVVELLFDAISPKKPYCSTILKCLERIGPRTEITASSFLPYGICQIITIMNSPQQYRPRVIFRSISLLNTYIVHYTGAVDLFISSSSFKQLLLIMTDILENCDAELGLTGTICVANAFKYGRQTIDIPVEELNKFLNSVGSVLHKKSHDSKREVLKSTSEDDEHAELDKGVIGYSPLCSMLAATSSLLHSMHSYLYSGRNIHLKQPEHIVEVELSLAHIFFVVVMNAFSHLDTKNITSEFVSTLMEVTAMYTYGVCQNVVVAEVIKSCKQTHRHFEKFRSCVSYVLESKIRKSFSLLLPFVYKICFWVDEEKFASASSCFGIASHKITYTTKEALLTMVTINSSTFSNLGLISETTKSLASFLGDDDLIMWASLLLHGFRHLSGADYEYLGKYLGLNMYEEDCVDICTSAVSVICTLLNRSIDYIDSSNTVKSNTSEYYNSRFFKHRVTLTCETLKLIIQFPNKAGVNFFQRISVLVTVEFLITYTCLPGIGSSLDYSSMSDEYEKGLSILSSALLDRLQPVHTLALLRTPNFSNYLENSSPCWIEMAQKIILQCHSDELLIDEQAFLLIPTTYTLLFNTWTVLYNCLLQVDNFDVLQRLVVTFEKRLIMLKEQAQSVEDLKTFEVQRNRFSLRVCDCLSVLPNNLSGCFLKVFSNVDLKYLYVKVLKVVCTQLEELFLNTEFIMMVAQQVIQFLVDDQCTVTSVLRTDLLKILLHLLMNNENGERIQIVKLLCSEIKYKDKSIFYFTQNTIENSPDDRLKTHCTEFQITAVEMDAILGIGALVNMCTKDIPVKCELADCIKPLIFMKPETILTVLNHDSIASGSHFTKASALICLSESLYGELAEFLWPDLHSHEDYYCELLMCLVNGIMDVTRRFAQELSIEVYGCFIKYVYITAKPQSLINFFLMATPWSNIIFEYLKSDDSANRVSNLPISFLNFIDMLLSTKSPAVYTIISKRQLRKLLMMYIHDEDLQSSNLKSLLRSISEKIAYREFEVLEDADQFCLEVMLDSDDQLPAASISDRFISFYRKVFLS